MLRFGQEPTPQDPESVAAPALALHPRDWLGLNPGMSAWFHAGAGLAAGYGLILGIRLLGRLIFKKEAMGLGDAKLLALIGVGRVLVYDMDRIERSNLSRGVLFRDDDEGALKVDVAARRMRELNPEIRVTARAENVVHRAGLGVFLWADVVICGLDNREARVFVNSACARTGRTWVDGAVEGLAGVEAHRHCRARPCP